MIGHLAYAAGSPCPTLVLDARDLPREEGPLLAALTESRRWLEAGGAGHVLKIALVEPSRHPLFDLDYRFVQALPAAVDRFDVRGSCGHSILASITAVSRTGLVHRLGPGVRNRVRVLNNGDHLVCEVDEVDRDQVEFTVHFVRNPPTPVEGLLLTGEPRTRLDVAGRRVDVSLVSAGNPYVFVDAAGAGVASRDELFADDPVLMARLLDIRAAAAAHLGWPAESVFPKVAVVLPDEHGTLAARAISVPSWHPTLALTGAACLGAATGIEGTVPWLAAREVGCVDGRVGIATPGGTTSVTAATVFRDGTRELAWISVSHKVVTFHGSFFVEPLARFQLKEIGGCLSLPA
ncbi:PrpF domain-containing protein [Actinophytocola sp.]|uniref:PrpF domain-containing protein n=1 Tax=Actinophytocola sp. TaxID=1872138 RepID=UPI00389AF606